MPNASTMPSTYRTIVAALLFVFGLVAPSTMLAQDATTADSPTVADEVNKPDDKTASTTSAKTTARQHVILVLGASGAAEFEEPFRKWAEQWRDAAKDGEAELTAIGLESGEKSDRDQLQAAAAAAQTQTTEPLWLVLIGHGTFNGRAAKFNLQGRDVSAAELKLWLEGAKRPIVVINCASSSGPFINRLSAPERVIVTATKSGFESNYARFGGEMANAVLGGAADLDKDGQSSLLEAFLTASSRVAEFYQQEGRLATEHALLDDNSDKLGTPATFFQGARAVKAAKKGAQVDGRRAAQIVLKRSERERALTSEQRAERDRLEQQIAKLRDRKQQLSEEVYYNELEELLVQLSEVLLVGQD